MKIAMIDMVENLVGPLETDLEESMDLTISIPDQTATPTVDMPVSQLTAIANRCGSFGGNTKRASIGIIGEKLGHNSHSRESSSQDPENLTPRHDTFAHRSGTSLDMSFGPASGRLSFQKPQ
jgi:hypothetical protein